MTSAALSAELAALVGRDHLYFYDAISPIVLAESIDRARVFRGSRWDESAGGDYLNCPLDAEEYRALHEALVTAELADLHDFDEARFFEGCLPVEVMARRGLDTLRFGPLKPVGLTDPATGRRPHAVVQLRQDNLAAEHYSLVGFQTQLKWGEQRRVLRMIPGLEQGEFVRYGMIHRNTYINAPTVLRETLQTRRDPNLLIAGTDLRGRRLRRVGGVGAAGGHQRRGAGAGAGGVRPAAHDRHGRPGVLRIACASGRLPADERGVRAAAVPRRPAAQPARAAAGARRAGAAGPGGLVRPCGEAR